MVAILYAYKMNPDNTLFGHWVGLKRNRLNQIDHFDSLKSFPDHELNNISSDFKNKHGEEEKYLLKLLYDSNYIINYNDIKLQGNTTSTCGRWVSAFLKTNKTLEEFQKLFGRNTDANDRKIIQMTNDIKM